MISLSENKTSLVNLGSTIKTLETLEKLIEYYKEDKPGPAYCTFQYALGGSNPEVQFNRQIIVDSLLAQKEDLTNYLATLGIDANN